MRWSNVFLQTIIEVDGINVQPLTVDSIQIFAGQRYSFVLDANQPVGNYWIRALPNLGPTGFVGGVNSAILRYVFAPNRDPTTTQTPPTRPLRETNLVPLENPGAPGGSAPADVAINLAILFDPVTRRFLINGATFTPPESLPVLLQIISKTTPPQDLLPKGSVYALPRDKVIELTLPGGSPGSPVSQVQSSLSAVMKHLSAASIPSPWCKSVLVMTQQIA